jgi:hypothetical protein
VQHALIPAVAVYLHAKSNLSVSFYYRSNCKRSVFIVKVIERSRGLQLGVCICMLDILCLRSS